jgi:hypothetical protein
MRFGSTFDLVLEVVAFAWQELRDFIDTARTTGTERPRCITYRLADLEFVISHSILHRQIVSIAMKVTTEVRVRSLVAQLPLRNRRRLCFELPPVECVQAPSERCRGCSLSPQESDPILVNRLACAARLCECRPEWGRRVKRTSAGRYEIFAL